MDHIVDFLTKKGFSIESNPNTKLPGDAYTLLLEEFRGDKKLKEEAQQLTQTKMKREGKEVLDAETTKKAPAKKDDDVPEILIKNVSAGEVISTEGRGAATYPN